MNVLATYNLDGELTGLIVNVPSPSQQLEHEFLISADWWYETRRKLRDTFGSDLYILPQCSAAGELTTHLLYDREAQERMLKLMGRTKLEEIAHRIHDSVAEVLPAIHQSISYNPVFSHCVDYVELPLNRLTEDDARQSRAEAERLRVEYERELKRLDDDPALKDEPRWYVPVTTVFRQMNWHMGVVNRYELKKSALVDHVEIHTIRIGDIAIATNPFECYLDYGIQIKVNSSATQTFLVQLAGSGTYLPSPRSVRGGGYGSVPASNPVGPEGGQKLAEHTISAIAALWK